jgi:hypothetical protein
MGEVCRRYQGIKNLQEKDLREKSTFSSLYKWTRSLDSLVGIATGYGLDDRGVGVRVPIVKHLLLFTSSRQILGPTGPFLSKLNLKLFPRR